MRYRRIRTIVAMGLVFGLHSACLGRPSLDEAAQELARLVDPAVRAGFAEVDAIPAPLTSSEECGEPLLGPSEGLRPTISYELPLSNLKMDPATFISAVENVWREQGAEVEADDNGRLLSRYASTKNYRARAIVNFENEDVYIGGSGPCVDDPNR